MLSSCRSSVKRVILLFILNKIRTNEGEKIRISNSKQLLNKRAYVASYYVYFASSSVMRSAAAGGALAISLFKMKVEAIRLSPYHKLTRLPRFRTNSWFSSATIIASFQLLFYHQPGPIRSFGARSTGISRRAVRVPDRYTIFRRATILANSFSLSARLNTSAFVIYRI